MKRHRSLRIAAALIAGSASALAQTTFDETHALTGYFTVPGDKAGYPITIKQPGHYLLRSNLNVPVDTAGIEVTADNVTIDLNGFSVTGTKTCQRDAGSYAVTCGAGGNQRPGIEAKAVNGLVVRNGRIQGFTIGLDAAPNVTAEDLVLSNNRTCIRTTPWIKSVGMTRLIRSHLSHCEFGATFSSEGVVVRESVFSRNGTAITGGTAVGIPIPGSDASRSASGPLSVSKSAVVSNQIGFGVVSLGAAPQFGLNGVFLRDNKTNNVAGVFAY